MATPAAGNLSSNKLQTSIDAAAILMIDSPSFILSPDNRRVMPRFDKTQLT